MSVDAVELLRELSGLMLPAAYLASAEGLELELKSWPAFYLRRKYRLRWRSFITYFVP